MSADPADRSIDEILGAAVSGGDVVRALQTTLRDYTPGYLTRLGVRYDKAPGQLARVAWWRAAGQLIHDGDEPLPMCATVTPGLAKRPVDDGEGIYLACWDVRAALVVATGGPQTDTLDVATIYGLAVRLAATQHGDLGGLATSTTWVGETYDDLNPADDATRSIAVVRFEIDVDGALDTTAGPTTPDPLGAGPDDLDPYPPPVIDQLLVDIEARALNAFDDPEQEPEL